MLFNFNIQPLIQYLHAHPHSAGVIAFIVVFAEALAVVGVIVPGSITMTAIGMLIGSAVIPAGSTFIWGICGAILGDYISYLVGIYFQDRMHRVWPFNKHPQLLERSELFFRKHGGKSIVIGRFVGPLRAMIPMVAGMFKMRQGKFLLAAIPSASVWAVGYMVPGILLGALSLELPPKLATQFVLGVLLIFISIWLVIWLMHHFFSRTCSKIDRAVMHLWKYMQQHTTLRWFTELLADPHEPDNHRQLTLVLATLTTAVLFFVFLYNVLFYGPLTIFNHAVYYLITSFRVPAMDHIMVAITFIGDEHVVVAAAGLIFMWFVWKRNWYVAAHLFTITALCVATIEAMKTFFYSARPDVISGAFSKELGTSSFPSGHVTLVVALLGFLAVIIARELPPKQRRLPYLIVTIITFLVSFSRLYLGVHWLTDVLGGIFLGLTLVLLLTISYSRRHTTPFSARSFSAIAVSIFTVVWLLYNLLFYHEHLAAYAVKYPMHALTMQQWQNQPNTVPLYRLNRLGHPIHAFNIQWVGTVDEVRTSLLQQGWQEYKGEFDWKNLVQSLSVESINHHFPLLTPLYHDRPPALLLINTTEKDDTIVILRLWRADLQVNNENLLLGTIEYHRNSGKIFSLHRHKTKTSVTAADYLIPYLEEFKYQQVVYPQNIQPPEMLYLGWDGKVLLIQRKQ